MDIVSLNCISPPRLPLHQLAWEPLDRWECPQIHVTGNHVLSKLLWNVCSFVWQTLVLNLLLFCVAEGTRFEATACFVVMACCTWHCSAVQIEKRSELSLIHPPCLQCLTNHCQYDSIDYLVGWRIKSCGIKWIKCVDTNLIDTRLNSCRHLLACFASAKMPGLFVQNLKISRVDEDLTCRWRSHV